MHRPQGPRRPRAQAGSRRHPRHRVRGAAAAARARPPRPRRSARPPRSTRSRSSRPAATSSRDDAARLDDAYRFLRTVEHRLQLYDEQQTHTHPGRRAARARAWPGCSATATAATRPRSSASRPTTAAPAPRCARIHERLFFAPLLDTLAGRRPAVRRGSGGAPRRVRLHRRRAHARRGARARRRASPAARGCMQQLLPVILELAVGDTRPRPRPAPAPATGRGPGALGLARADVPRRLRGAAERTCRLLGSSRLARRRAAPPSRVRRRPRRRRRARQSRSRGPSSSPRRSTTSSGAATPSERRDGLRRFKRRELLRIAARDLLGFAVARGDRARAHRARRSVPRGSAAVASAAVAVRGDRHGPPRRRRASYASDIDVLFVYDGEGADDFDAAEHVAEQLVQEIGATTAEGQTFRIDARLRPEGNQGPLARSLGGLRGVLRAVGPDVGAPGAPRRRGPSRATPGSERLRRARRAVRVRATRFTDDDVREVRRMKARIERERIPPGEDPQFHLKLGPRLAVRRRVHGAAAPARARRATIRSSASRRRSTRSHGCARPTLLDADDADALEEAYRFCELARNARYLQTGRPGDALPTDGREATRLGLLLGYVHQPQASAARRLPPRDPSGAQGRRARVLRARVT